MVVTGAVDTLWGADDALVLGGEVLIGSGSDAVGKLTAFPSAEQPVRARAISSVNQTRVLMSNYYPLPPR